MATEAEELPVEVTFDATKKKKKKKKKNDMEERESKVQAACVSPKDQPKQTTKKLKKERLKDNKQEPDRPKAGKKRKRTEQARDSAVALTEPIEPRQPAAKAAQRTTSEADTTATDDSAVRDDLTEKPKTDWHAPPLPHMRGKPFTKEEDKLLLELAQDALRNKGLEPGSEEANELLRRESKQRVRLGWEEIAAHFPSRSTKSVWTRGYVLLHPDYYQRWKKEDVQALRALMKEHNNVKHVAKLMQRHPQDVKDKWSEYEKEYNRGRWSGEEAKKLERAVRRRLSHDYYKNKVTSLDAVNDEDGVPVRDDLPWEKIKDEIGSRSAHQCLTRWYGTMVPASVANNEWDLVADIKLLEALVRSGAEDERDVQWARMLPRYNGSTCRRRWHDLVKALPSASNLSFSARLEALAKEICPELLEG
mmetsp:Transcript_6169/g.22668  ORF Transcript_6169/g.22668 Transcript_6169/m.22668 type:complete len:420 (+) Transcript_6169:198-1457(+)